jgi:cytochrome b561
MFKNSTTGYGWPSIILHWLSALLIFGLFGLGLYMVELDYYDDWYHDSTHWHESLGLLFFALLVGRIIWRQLNPKPAPIATTQLQKWLARLAHGILYLLMLLIPISGYLISTADGHGVALFSWFKVPSITGNIDNMETISGQFHYWLSILIIALGAGHVGAAIKHHWLDKDDTLKRMLRTTKQ